MFAYIKVIPKDDNKDYILFPLFNGPIFFANEDSNVKSPQVRISYPGNYEDADLVLNIDIEDIEEALKYKGIPVGEIKEK